MIQLAIELVARLRNKPRFLSVGVFVCFGCLLLGRVDAASPAEIVRPY